MDAIVVRSDDSDDVFVRPNISPTILLDISVLDYLALLIECFVKRFIEACLLDGFFDEEITFGLVNHFLKQFFLSDAVRLFLLKYDVLSVESETDKAKIVWWRKVLEYLGNQGYCFLLVKLATVLSVNDEQDTSLRNVMVAQKFVDWFALYHITLRSLFRAHSPLWPEGTNHFGS